MPSRVVAVVKDLFFVARIGETARLTERPLTFARGPAELEAALEGERPGLVIVDLTMPGWDYDAVFGVLGRRAPQVPVLGFTTHALARDTQALHGRCRRVMTKDTLTRELGRLLQQEVAE